MIWYVLRVVDRKKGVFFMKLNLILTVLVALISQQAKSECDVSVLTGSYSAKGELYDPIGAAGAPSLNPFSTSLIFDGAGGLAVKYFAYVYFPDDADLPEGVFLQGSGGYVVNDDCTGAMEFAVGFPDQGQDLAKLTVPFVLFGSGSRAEGLRGAIKLVDLEEGGRSGSTGQIDAVRQTLQSTGVTADDMKLTFEEPVNLATTSGISNIRGWALSPDGIDRVELYINGTFSGEIPYGGARGDVGEIFPDTLNSDKSGFGQVFNFAALGAGEHTMKVVAVSSNGGMIEKTAIFEVAAFEDAFIGETGFPSLREASVSLNPDTGDVTLQNVRLPDESSYDVILKWSRAAQNFLMVQVKDF
jgi:hypothetical protein